MPNNTSTSYKYLFENKFTYNNKPNFFTQKNFGEIVFVSIAMETNYSQE